MRSLGLAVRSSSDAECVELTSLSRSVWLRDFRTVMAEVGTVLIIKVCTGAAADGPSASGQSAAQTINRCLTGRVDPDDIQVAKVVALRVQPVAAGAALGPRSLLRWDSVTDLHLWLCHQRKAQTILHGSPESDENKNAGVSRHGREQMDEAPQ